MNRAELIKKVSERAKIRPNAARAIVSTIFDEMRECLVRGERIEIRGFGSFVARHYEAYKGRNPKTGQIVDVLPKKLPHFKVGRELKKIVNTRSG